MREKIMSVWTMQEESKSKEKLEYSELKHTEDAYSNY